MVLLPSRATMHSKMPAPLLLSLSHSDTKPSNMRCSMPSAPSHAISTQACRLSRRGIITSGSTCTCGGAVACSQAWHHDRRQHLHLRMGGGMQSGVAS